MPLEMVVPREQVNRIDAIDDFPEIGEPDQEQAAILAAAASAGCLLREGGFHVIPGEVRRLEQLLWLGHLLEPCGFRFRQEYVFDDEGHRVVARNRLKARADGLFERGAAPDEMSPQDFLLYVAVVTALCADVASEYIFMRCADAQKARAICERMKRDFNVAFTELESPSDGLWLRTTTVADADSFLNIVRRHLETVPCATERFYDASRPHPYVLVAKELVFDAAHFITDHPGKCSNLHGGRYKIIVKLEDRIDPHTGFVADYGLLKSLMKFCVVDRLDHKCLNLTAHDLAWRSSTELLSVFIWERLIAYLPNLFELQIYETEQSYCSYRGPDLEEYQREGVYSTGGHFGLPNLGRSMLRRRLGLSKSSFRMSVIDSSGERSD